VSIIIKIIRIDCLILKQHTIRTIYSHGKLDAMKTIVLFVHNRMLSITTYFIIFYFMKRKFKQ